MFDDFGKEQVMLQQLVKGLPWRHLETYQQRKIWEARIEWLERMREPRLWLCYLMAKRRRILKKATVLVLARFKEKSQLKTMGSSHIQTPGTGVSTIMISETSQTIEELVHGQSQTASEILARSTMINDANQALETTDGTQEPVPSKLISAARELRLSFGSERRGSQFREHSPGNCPIFDRPFEANRKDIKHQVELLMPQPKPYLVIGWFPKSASDPKERILEFDLPEHLFRILRHGEGDVRGWRRFVSLKSLKGFGLYKVSLILQKS
jgi:hypothetical protein